MPLERVRSEFKDISLSLKRNPLNKDLVILSNENAIARSIRNLVSTSKGEKFFEPYIGTLVNELLFNNLNEDIVRQVKDEITLVIENDEPRVSLLEVIVIPDYDNNALDVTITYQIIGIEALPQQLSFVLLPTR